MTVRRPFPLRGRPGLVAAWGAVLFGAAPARAELAHAPDYPASVRTADVLAWTAAATSIAKGSILITTPELVVALVRAERRPDGTVDAAVREEVIDPQMAARMGARSLASEVAFDCPGRRRRFLGDVAYPQADLKGAPRPIKEPSDWAPTPDGTITAEIQAAVCKPPAPPEPPPVRVPTPPPAAPPPHNASAPSPPSPAPGPAAPPPPTAGSTASGPGFIVRIGSFGHEANARAAAAVLKAVLPAGSDKHDVAVRSVTQGSKRYFVVEGDGFADRAEASAFCRSARSKLPDCVVAEAVAERRH